MTRCSGVLSLVAEARGTRLFDRPAADGLFRQAAREAATATGLYAKDAASNGRDDQVVEVGLARGNRAVAAVVLGPYQDDTSQPRAHGGG